MHQNFMDLNYAFEKEKYARAKDLADVWRRRIGEQLIGKVEEEARANFNTFIGAGNSLQYKELKKLNTVWKKDYVKILLSESKTMKTYID